MRARSNLPIMSSSSPSSEWTPPSDWPVLNPADNEIEMIVSDQVYPGIAVTITVAGDAGTYSIDWGDDTIDTLIASDAVKEHLYEVGEGTPCSLGYTTWKLKIYGATDNITGIQFGKHSGYIGLLQSMPILAAVFGTNHLIDLTEVFSDYNDVNFYLLQYVKLPDLPDCISINAFLGDTYDMQKFEVGELPIVVDLSQLISYSGVKNLTLGNLPLAELLVYFAGQASMLNKLIIGNIPNATSIIEMLTDTYNLVLLSIGNMDSLVSNYSQAFYYSPSLQNLNIDSMLGLTESPFDAALPSLQIVTGCENWFSRDIPCNIELFKETYMITSPIVMNCLLDSFKFVGTSEYQNKINSVRLLNPNSPFGGSSPQVDVSYTSMGVAALELLFGDLPTVTGGQVIDITGCTGALTADSTIATNKGWTVIGGQA
jgi:hypothetical protein